MAYRRSHASRQTRTDTDDYFMTIFKLSQLFPGEIRPATLARLAGFALTGAVLAAPAIKAADPAPDAVVSWAEVQPQGVVLEIIGDTMQVTMPRSAWQDPAREPLSDRDFMALVPVDFGDGSIELEVMSSLADGAPDFARAFVGVAFRVADGSFEKIYLRPTNGIAQDQVRRNHSVQYAAFPDFRFDRLRREAPERYETAADIAPDRWIHMRIEVSGATARLYLDHRPNPVLLVNDLKLGADRRGAVGLWVETGTVAQFRNLRISPALPPSE